MSNLGRVNTWIGTESKENRWGCKNMYFSNFKYKLIEKFMDQVIQFKKIIKS